MIKEESKGLDVYGRDDGADASAPRRSTITRVPGFEVAPLSTPVTRPLHDCYTAISR